MRHYIHFQRSDALFENFNLPEDAEHDRKLGPFDEFVQLTYEGLRVGPDGDHIAYFDYTRGAWFIERDDSPWSDVVIYAETEEGTVEMCPYCLCTDGEHDDDCEDEKANSADFACPTCGYNESVDGDCPRCNPPV